MLESKWGTGTALGTDAALQHWGRTTVFEDDEMDRSTTLQLLTEIWGQLRFSLFSPDVRDHCRDLFRVLYLATLNGG